MQYVSPAINGHKKSGAYIHMLFARIGLDSVRCGEKKIITRFCGVDSFIIDGNQTNKLNICASKSPGGFPGD